MSLKLANNQVYIYLKNAQAYLREAHDLCPVKSCLEWETIEKSFKRQKILSQKL